jgi:hypothetical protein
MIPTQHVLAPLKLSEEVTYRLPGDGLVRVQLLTLQPNSDNGTELTIFFRVNGESRPAKAHDLSREFRDSLRLLHNNFS